MNNPHFANHKI